MPTMPLRHHTLIQPACARELGPCKGLALALVLSSLFWAGILKAVVSLV